MPGYRDGIAAHGVWHVSRIFVDAMWESSADPDRDVAFLEIGPSIDGNIQDVTGAPPLGRERSSNRTVRVIGFPNSADRPITCRNNVIAHGSRQMEFRCKGFTSGTSGGPFIAADGAIIGVIGGYQEGGYGPDVSFSITFGTDVRALYATATAEQ
jgi:Trypsin-like peptidase domain